KYSSTFSGVKITPPLKSQAKLYDNFMTTLQHFFKPKTHPPKTFHKNINSPLHNFSYRGIVYIQVEKHQTCKYCKGGKPMSTLKLKTRVQVIYYQSDQSDLRKEYATSEKRISLDEAEEILQERNIAFEQIFKVQYERHTLELKSE